MLVNSLKAKLLAVKGVTQDNRAKKTAGGDGLKCFTPTQRYEMAVNLKLDGKTDPPMRGEIPQENGKVKPLGIPTLRDRANQALAKLALEPEWEAKFAANSYGFRPGRSCHDAIIAIELEVRREAKYVLDADITGCFANISHNGLIQKCNTFPAMERQIKAWLKSDVMKGNVFPKTELGEPQTAGISPLLANIALHGLETHIATKFSPYRTQTEMPQGKIAEICAARLIRYADYFVIIHAREEVILEAKEEVESWLAEMGLKLNESKTRICHTKEWYKGEKPGFDFLGFNIRTFDTGKYQSETNVKGEKLMLVTKIKPSTKSVRKFTTQVKKVLDESHNIAPELMIKRLSLLIRGWGNYFKIGSHSRETFEKLEFHHLHKLYLNWGRKRFSQHGIGYITRKIFHHSEESSSTFGWKDGSSKYLVPTLYGFRYTKYTKVQGTRSPYDGDWLYWMGKMGN
jgi:RNA-directed DNA polymerase